MGTPGTKLKLNKKNTVRIMAMYVASLSYHHCPIHCNYNYSSFKCAIAVLMQTAEIIESLFSINVICTCTAFLLKIVIVY